MVLSGNKGKLLIKGGLSHLNKHVATNLNGIPKVIGKAMVVI